MKFIPTDKKRNKINSKQQAAQKQKMKLMMRAGAVVLVLLIVCVTLFVHLSRPDQSTAGTDGKTGWTVVNNPEYVNDMSLPAPVITHTAIAKSTVQCRVPKAQNTNQ